MSTYRFRNVEPFQPGDCCVCDGDSGKCTLDLMGHPVCQSCLQQVRGAEKYSIGRMLAEVKAAERRVRCLLVARHGLDVLRRMV